MQNAVENVVEEFGNIGEIKYSAWRSGMLLGEALRTLGEIIARPFVRYSQFERRNLI
jgi:hypothetical protein